MHWRRTIGSCLAMATAVGLYACSKSSSGPSDPVVGNWKFTLTSSMSLGTFSPNTFTLALAASGTGYSATLPAMSYSSGSFGTYAFDSVGSIQFALGGDTTIAIGRFVKMHGDTLVGVRLTRSALADTDCEFALVLGLFNATRDTIQGSVDIINKAQGSVGCNDFAGYVAVKQ